MVRRVTAICSALIVAMAAIAAMADEVRSLTASDNESKPLGLAGENEKSWSTRIVSKHSPAGRWTDFVKALAFGGNCQDIYLQISLTDGKSSESIWAVPEVIDGNQVRARIFSEPKMLSSYKKGQVLQVGLNQIADWNYSANYENHGTFYTLVYSSKQVEKRSARAENTIIDKCRELNQKTSGGAKTEGTGKGKITVMAEYGSSGIWIAEAIGPFRHGMITYEGLGLSGDLKKRFARWIDEYETVPSKGEHFAFDRHNRQGRELARALKRLLGDVYVVEFEPQSKNGGLPAPEEITLVRP